MQPEVTHALPAEGAALALTANMTEAEFREFYELTARPLKSYLLRLTGSVTLAEDLLQDSYYRLLRTRLPAGLDQPQKRSYLFRIATNLARDHFRARKFAPEQLEERAAGVKETVSQSDIASDMAKALDGIKPQERELVLLAYVEGASHREIAAVTGLKEASVRPLLFRVKQKLAALLRERGYQRGATE